MSVFPGGGFKALEAAELLSDLIALGVRPGRPLFVQSSLRSVGPLEGGAETLVQALRQALGPAGTLVAYTATPENSLSSPAHRNATAGLSKAELALFHAGMPAFDALLTPASATVGALSEIIRTTPGALRSSHPQTSFAALGPAAPWIVGTHPLGHHLDDLSPLGRLYEADAMILQIGVPGSQCTPYHLAECRVPDPPLRPYRCVVRGADGTRQWVGFQGVALDDSVFPLLDLAVRRSVLIREGRLGRAPCRLMPLVGAVDAATDWFARRRQEALSHEGTMRTCT